MKLRVFSTSQTQNCYSVICYFLFLLNFFSSPNRRFAEPANTLSSEKPHASYCVGDQTRPSKNRRISSSALKLKKALKLNRKIVSKLKIAIYNLQNPIVYFFLLKMIFCKASRFHNFPVSRFYNFLTKENLRNFPSVFFSFFQSIN